MLRPIFCLAALAVSFAASSAMAEDIIIVSPANRAVDEGTVQMAQDGNYEVFYDGRGNKVTIDDRTGKVISVEPPETRFEQRALRRQERLRRLRGEDAYGGSYSDVPDDQANLRRRPMRGDDGYLSPDDSDAYGNQDAYGRNYDNGQDDGADDNGNYGSDDGGGSLQQFPPAPRSAKRKPDSDQAALPKTQDQPSTDQQPIERKPLNEEASIAPAQPPQAEGETDQDNQPAFETPKIEPGVSVNSSLALGSSADIAALQVLLDRGGASPGVIDGRFGSNVDKALAAYNQINNANLKSTDSAGIKDALAKSGGDAFASYTITPEDVAGPYVASIPEDYSQKAKLDRMGYTSVTEALAERFHMDEGYLKSINQGVSFDRPGTIIKVANFGKLVSTPVAHIVADKGNKEVYAYDASGKLVAAYPATIGSTDTPSPTGTHAVSRVAFDPNYTYNPNINFKQGDNTKVLTIPPGPNGPVGSIWIALDKPTYGIHGTPDPSKIGKTASHGCVRLTNWDANELAKLVKPGVAVEFVD